MPEIIAQIVTPVLEMFVLAVMYYYVFLFLRGTRGWQMLVAFVVALLLLLFVTEFFHLTTLNWVLAKFTTYIAIAFIVIFQPEIRRALAELGKQHVFAGTQQERGLCDHLVQAILMLAERKIGALIAVEQEIGTRTIQETGTPMDARVTPELLATIFYPGTPVAARRAWAFARHPPPGGHRTDRGDRCHRAGGFRRDGHDIDCLSRTPASPAG